MKLYFDEVMYVVFVLGCLVGGLVATAWDMGGSMKDSKDWGPADHLAAVVMQSVLVIGIAFGCLALVAWLHG